MASKHPKTSRLQTALARRLLAWLKDENAPPGRHLVEQELCDVFGVSRTPVRGALKLLAAEGWLNPRPGRGFVLAKIPVLPAREESEEDEEQRLFDTLARARAAAKLPDMFTQQEILRRFHARLGTVMEVLRKMKELGLIERKSGHGWVFAGDSTRLFVGWARPRRTLGARTPLPPDELSAWKAGDVT